MRNFRLCLCYDGSRYRGWQKQGNTPGTIQEKLETLLSRLLEQPVELNASGRAVAILEGGFLPEDEVRGVRKVLSAAALTYVAAALQAVLQLLRLVILAGGRRRDD